MTTKEALNNIFTNKASAKRLGVLQTTLYVWKCRYLAGTLSMDKQHEIIINSGYKPKNTLQWTND